jgi:putative alpha-1,2-mannosidase
MAKPVPDSSTAWQNQAGFLHDQSFFTGISQLHDEGTGGSPSLGNFPIWMSKCKGTTWGSCPTSWGQRMGKRVGEPRAQVGQFGVEIDTGFDFGIIAMKLLVIVEMTSTRRTNLFRIKALDTADMPVLSVGLMDLSASTISAWSEVRKNFRVVGNGTFRPSFGEGIH